MTDSATENTVEQHTTAYDPHTAIPDWLTFSTVSASAYRVAAAMLASKPLPATQIELAERLHVDVRSIKRWQDELRNAGMLTSYKAGRRVINVFHRCELVTQRSLTQRSPNFRSVIAESPISHGDHGSLDPSQSQKRAIGDRAITDRSHGGGGGHHDIDYYVPPTNQKRLEQKFVRPADEPYTLTEKHMISAWRFSLRKAFSLRALDLDNCIADYTARWEAGGRAGSIIAAWETAPPPPASSNSTANKQAGELDMAALRAQYPGLYGLPDDRSTLLDRGDPDIDQFLIECGL